MKAHQEWLNHCITLDLAGTECVLLGDVERNEHGSSVLRQGHICLSKSEALQLMKDLKRALDKYECLARSCGGSPYTPGLRQAILQPEPPIQSAKPKTKTGLRRAALEAARFILGDAVFVPMCASCGPMRALYSAANTCFIDGGLTSDYEEPATVLRQALRVLEVTGKLADEDLIETAADDA